MIPQGKSPSMQHRKKPAHPSGFKQSKRQSNAKPTGAIRIISGHLRGRKLPVLDVEGLRPTTDRTKETLFNWLMTDIHGMHSLDAFSGSGSLGFEALSRGAASVSFIEKDKSVAKQIISNLQLLKVEDERANVVNQDAIFYFTQAPVTTFDLIFLDPPFNKGLVKQALDNIQQQQWLKHGGLLYLEMEQPMPLELEACWETLKIKETSQFSYRLLRYIGN